MTTHRPLLPRLIGGLAAAVLGIGIGLTLMPEEAEAANIPRQIQPGSRPHFFQFGFGVANAFVGAGGFDDPDLDPDYRGPYGWGRGRGDRWWYGHSTFKFQQELGFHLNGTPKGPALGFIVQEEIGYNNFYGGLPFGFVIAPRFQWDIQPVKNLALYLAPNISVGYHGIVCNRCDWNGLNIAHFANIQFGMNARLVVVDRFIAWLVLPEFEFMVGPYGSFVGRYQFMTGVGIAFP